MTKRRRLKRDHLRPLLSEVLPYEVPLPFSAIGMYDFLRRISFEWIDETSFSVKKVKLNSSARLWLSEIFHPLNLSELKPSGERLCFEIKNLARNGELRKTHPMRYKERRSNGKRRVLTIPHPHAMLDLARFVHTHADSIVYYTNRSHFSARHPSRVARIEFHPDDVYSEMRDNERFDLEQHNLEYNHASSYFSYRKFNQIHRLYSSEEFAACERKYPTLLRMDVSKCFDSIYTHTLPWVTEGLSASKTFTGSVQKSFGGRFDRYMQNINYGETSGIIIGPEISRIFAEIILQQIDLNVERRLRDDKIVRGEDYEVFRYVDDYFIFLRNPALREIIESTLGDELARFKLHVNESKTEVLATPLLSVISVAKKEIREFIKKRTECEVDLSGTEPAGSLSLSGAKVILDYKSTLVLAGLQHAELVNYFLYAVSSRMEKSARRYIRYIDAVTGKKSSKELQRARATMLKYLMANIEVAAFAYAGSPTLSHSLKLARITVAGTKLLERAGASVIEVSLFRDKCIRELRAQIFATRDGLPLGAHDLTLLDCLTHLGSQLDADDLETLRIGRGLDPSKLDALEILTLLRNLRHFDDQERYNKKLITRAKQIVSLGESLGEHQTQAAILRLSLPTIPHVDPKVVTKVLGTTPERMSTLRATEGISLFNWDVDDFYYEHLVLKSARVVY